MALMSTAYGSRPDLFVALGGECGARGRSGDVPQRGARAGREDGGEDAQEGQWRRHAQDQLGLRVAHEPLHRRVSVLLSQ